MCLNGCFNLPSAPNQSPPPIDAIHDYVVENYLKTISLASHAKVYTYVACEVSYEINTMYVCTYVRI